MNNYDTDYLDEEEKELMESIDKVDSIALTETEAEEQDKIKTAAGEYVKTKKKKNIQLDPYELEKVKELCI